MNISGLSAFRNNSEISDRFKEIERNVKSKTINGSFENNNPNIKNSNQIITKHERDFFINMFPDNSEQIEKHVLFNRNGKVQSNLTLKGTLFDATV